MKLRIIRYEDVNLTELSLDTVPCSGYIPRLDKMMEFLCQMNHFCLFKPME
jgi:hypothetical protein